MPLKILSSGRHTKNINGENVMDKKFGIDIDSERDNSQEVSAMVNQDGKKYALQDSLQNFLQKMSNNDNSLFKLLKKEELQSKNPVAPISVCKKVQPSMSIVYKAKKPRKLRTTFKKLAENVKRLGKKKSKTQYKKGISEKLFDSDSDSDSDTDEDFIENDDSTKKKVKKAKGKKGKSRQSDENKQSRKKRKKKLSKKNKLAIAKKLVEQLSS